MTSTPLRRSASVLAALTLATTGTAALLTANPASAAGPTVTNGCITSTPEPRTTDKVDICYTMFKPAGASSSHQVPFVIHSHGWGGSRTTTASSFQKYLDAGFGVLSFDQRGFGESGGKAHVENPAFEGNDVRGLV